MKSFEAKVATFMDHITIMHLRNFLIIIPVIFCFNYPVERQQYSSNDFKTQTRYNFYSDDLRGEILVSVPLALKSVPVEITISSETRKLCEWNGVVSGDIENIGFSITSSDCSGKITTEITDRAGNRRVSMCEFLRLKHKANEVKIDRLTGGLVVNRKEFFPFGFYCYSPVYPTMPEEEIVRGFNMISPYQKILPGSIGERKAYMDRCAELGMKVHYNLLSVSGGGGVNSKIDSLDPVLKKEYLVSEIKTFMDHPALLAWYIADEPTGNRVAPGEIEDIYRLVKEIDPWHPVSVVFMAPFLSSRKYSSGTDIVMADPYPVPNGPVSVVGDVTASLAREYSGEKPVWIVPQAFGGGELWDREPTVQEIRSMTWQAIVKGAKGIQLFIKSGLSSFPKSTATWGECGKIALEVMSITPWLLSSEATPSVISDNRKVSVTSRYHNGQLLIMAVNSSNEASRVQFSISQAINGKALAVFENREVRVDGGRIADYISPLGTLIYRISIKKDDPVAKEWPGNMIKDPGFEYVTSPSVPTACYISAGGDRGATFFLDPAEHIEGNYSLKLHTPSADKSISVKLFPVSVRTGSTYLVSLWAKSDHELKFPLNNEPQFAEISLGDFGKTTFNLDDQWRQYLGIFNIPGDSVPSRKTNLVLRMPGQGTGWFDMIQMVEDPLQSKK